MNGRAANEIELTGFGNQLDIWQGKGGFQKWVRFPAARVPGKILLLVTRLENEGINLRGQVEFNLE